MSHGREVQIIAVDGGFIVEYNDLIQTQKDTGTKNAEGFPVKIPMFEPGKRQVAVRATVDDAMKLLAGQLVIRMEVKGTEKAMMEKFGALCYEDKSEKYADAKPGPSATSDGPSFMNKG